MKKYIGFGWSCGSFAVENSVKMLPVSAEQYEMLGGVPFGLKSDENIITTLTEPFDEIKIAAEILGMFVERKTFSEYEPFWDNLFEDVQTGKFHIVLGPVNMQKLFYIPFSSFYSNVDHYLALESMREDMIYVTDSDGFIQIPISGTQAKKMLNSDGEFNEGINFCYYVFGKQIPVKDHSQAILRANKIIRKNFIRASEKQPFLEVEAYTRKTLNAKEINNMLFNTNSLMYRKQLQKDFIIWHQSVGFTGLELALELLERQISLIALQKYHLKKYKTENILWDWKQLQKLEDKIADIFIKNL